MQLLTDKTLVIIQVFPLTVTLMKSQNVKRRSISNVPKL